jgi:hypothetical protein
MLFLIVFAHKLSGWQQQLQAYQGYDNSKGANPQRFWKFLKIDSFNFGGIDRCSFTDDGIARNVSWMRHERNVCPVPTTVLYRSLDW